MRACHSRKKEAGLTLFEVGVVVAILVVVAAVFLPALAVSKTKRSGINCVNNLKQIGLSYRIWEGDNGDISPMGIPVANGGAMEMVQTGDVLQVFMVMSNELSTPKILICPEDTNRVFATNFPGLSRSNISYFVVVDVTNDVNPQMILSGDCNLTVGKKPVGAGLLSLSTNDAVAWQPPRHGMDGNIGMADGSVQAASPANLHQIFIETGLATNRLAIP